MCIFVNARLGVVCERGHTHDGVRIESNPDLAGVPGDHGKRNQIHFASQAQFVDGVSEVRVARPAVSVGGLVVVVLNEHAAELGTNRKRAAEPVAHKKMGRQAGLVQMQVGGKIPTRQFSPSNVAEVVARPCGKPVVQGVLRVGVAWRRCGKGNSDQEQWSKQFDLHAGKVQREVQICRLEICVRGHASFVHIVRRPRMRGLFLVPT